MGGADGAGCPCDQQAACRAPPAQRIWVSFISPRCCCSPCASTASLRASRSASRYETVPTFDVKGSLPSAQATAVCSWTFCRANVKAGCLLIGSDVMPAMVCHPVGSCAGHQGGRGDSAGRAGVPQVGGEPGAVCALPQDRRQLVVCPPLLSLMFPSCRLAERRPLNQTHKHYSVSALHWKLLDYPNTSSAGLASMKTYIG